VPNPLFLYFLESQLIQQAVSKHHSKAENRNESDDVEDQKLAQGTRVNEDNDGREHQNDADNGNEPFDESTGLILWFHIFVPSKVRLQVFS
jgi:hypothetical protein